MPQTVKQWWHKPYTLPSELHELITPTTCSSAPKTCSFQNAPPNNKTIAENKTYNLVIKLMTLQNRLCAYTTQSLMERWLFKMKDLHCTETWKYFPQVIWQGSLVCCSPWGHKESDMTEQLNWTMMVLAWPFRAGQVNFPALPGGGTDDGNVLSTQEKDLSLLPCFSGCQSVTEYIGQHNACDPSKCPSLTNHFFSSTSLLA